MSLVLIDEKLEHSTADIEPEMVADDEENDIIDNADVKEKMPASLESTPHESTTFDPTRMYLNKIGYTPLLTAEEEIKYAHLALNKHLTKSNPV